MDAKTIQSLTLGEIAAVESLSGQSIDSLGNSDAPKGKTMAALAYVFKRRQDPTFKFDDALNLTMEQATAVLGAVEPDPTA